MVRSTRLKVWRRIRFYVANHVEVVMVDVDYFDHFIVVQRVGHWESDNRSLAAVNRALVVSVMQLSRADQRIESRWVDVVSDLFFEIGRASCRERV